MTQDENAQQPGSEERFTLPQNAQLAGDSSVGTSAGDTPTVDVPGNGDHGAVGVTTTAGKRDAVEDRSSSPHGTVGIPADEDDAPSLLDQMGGLSGLIATTLPIVVYVPANSFFGLTTAIVAALGLAALVFVWRLVRKETLQPAVSGFIGVIFCAAIAWFMGDAKGFFLYGIWMSLLYAVIFVISILVRWPAVGVIWKGIKGDGFGWRKFLRARRFYDVATVAWAIVFVARFIIQNHLYNAASTTALGVAKILMGWPLTAVVLLVTIWAVRKADAVIADVEEDQKLGESHE